MAASKILIFLSLFAILHKNNKHVLVAGLSSFNDFESSNDIFDIIVNYDELMMNPSTISPSTEDFSLDVVSFSYSNNYF